ncbi:MAG: ABC transporter [Owenweeksia sp.]|nr:ABC transporter [Owenweeksia sp.]
MIFFRIFRESLQFAIHALSVNKLRTILSLLGVTIGIFTIITVFTVVDSLERNIRDSVADLGSNVVYIQKMPWGAEGGEYKWWKYFQRPEPSYRELQQLQKRVHSAQAIAFAFPLRSTLKYHGNSIENATIIPASHDYYDIWAYDFQEGRYFSELESKSGSPVAVIGADIAEGLFGVQSAEGKEIKMLGRKVKVLGVFEKQGKSLVGQDVDATVLVPINFARTLMNVNNQDNAFIMAAARPGVEMEELKDDIRGAMRSLRRLKPKADDDFALNEISVISNGLDMMFSIIGGAGLVIGMFSILVGGFGIANIMFASVRERTNQIGIQKSLGAKNYFILLQFLLESVLLCFMGGILGLIAVFALVSIADSRLEDFDLSLSLGNIFQGIMISVIIGIISGFIPAWIASRLNPVDAIRTGQ